MAQTLGQSVGICVRRRRLALGLSQVEFAERAGFYQTYLSRIENGNANPTLNALDVLAAALGVTIFELFEEVRRERAIRQGRQTATRTTRRKPRTS